jgi:hypothetical protein
MAKPRQKWEPEPGEDNLGTEPNPVPPRPPPKHPAPSSPSSPSSTAPSIDWLGILFLLLAANRDRRL